MGVGRGPLAKVESENSQGQRVETVVKVIIHSPVKCASGQEKKKLHFSRDQHTKDPGGARQRW